MIKINIKLSTENNPTPSTMNRVASYQHLTIFSNERDPMICSICQCDYQVGEPEMKLPCGHGFHPDCLMPWISSNDTCPICRHPIHATMTREYATAIRNRFLVNMINRFRCHNKIQLDNTKRPVPCMSCELLTDTNRFDHYSDPLFLSSYPINPLVNLHLKLCGPCFSAMVDGAAIFIQTVARRLIQKQRLKRLKYLGIKPSCVIIV